MSEWVANPTMFSYTYHKHLCTSVGVIKPSQRPQSRLITSDTKLSHLPYCHQSHLANYTRVVEYGPNLIVEVKCPNSGTYIGLLYFCTHF